MENYAIHNLTSSANNFNTSKHLKDLAQHYYNAVKYLKGEKYESFNKPIVLASLAELRQRIESGLSTWGNNYQEQKKRQQKRLLEVVIAYNFIKNNY